MSTLRRRKTGTRAVSNRMSPSELRQAGEALYGSRWQTELAAALGVRDSARVREWLRGARPIPVSIRAELIALMTQRANALRNVALNTGSAEMKSTSPDGAVLNRGRVS
jgi:hypothetical protein